MFSCMYTIGVMSSELRVLYVHGVHAISAKYKSCNGLIHMFLVCLAYKQYYVHVCNGGFLSIMSVLISY